MHKLYQLVGYLKHPTDNQQLPENTKPDRQTIIQLHTNLLDIEQALQAHHHQPQNQQLPTIFQDLLTTIDGLLNVVAQIAKEIEENQHKLQEYDQIKQMVNNHHEIVAQLTHSQQTHLRKVYEDKQRVEQQYQKQIAVINNQLQQFKQKQAENDETLTQLRQQIEDFQQQVSTQQQQLIKQQTKCHQMQHKLNLLLSKDQRQSVQRVVDLQHLQLEHILYYRRLRKNIVGYLGVSDILSFTHTNKTFRSLFQPDMLPYVAATLNNQKESQLKKALKAVRYYEKIYQEFPNQNTKVNAIKYLFFSIKPGTYILPILQEEAQLRLTHKNSETEGDPSTRKGFNNILDFFKPKDKDKGKNGEKFQLHMLKNEEVFKNIQFKIATFFRNFLNLELPEDLHNFQEQMCRQFEQLKLNLAEQNVQGKSSIIWAAKLVCFAKFLYIQTTQINNLLQICFGKLVKTNQQLKTLEAKHDDMAQNENTLRSLVENLAKDKAKMEASLWNLQNKVLTEKASKEKYQNRSTQLSKDNQSLEKQNSKLKQANHQYKEQLERVKALKNGFEEKISWIKQQLKNTNILNENERERKPSESQSTSERKRRESEQREFEIE